MTASEPDRLRTPPKERFTGDTKPFDLDRIFQQLADEPHPSIDGHRQITLFKRGATTVLAILFEEEGRLPEHATKGVATIQVLQGRLEIETPDERHALADGGLLVLRPGVPHSVQALKPSRMLLTVHLVSE